MSHVPRSRFIAIFLCGCAVAVYAQFFTLDGLNGIIMPFLYPFYPSDTQYAPRYSDQAFRKVAIGTPDTAVADALGSPLYELWDYYALDHRCKVVYFRSDGRVLNGDGEKDCPMAPVRPGETIDAVRTSRGLPNSVSWIYSTSPKGQSYRERVIVLEGHVVTRKIADFYID